MIVATIEITAAPYAGHGFLHVVLYDDLDAAWKAYHEVAELLRARTARKNDLPALVELEGVTKLSLPLDEIRSVAIIDYAKQNEHQRGLRDAFPHINWK